MITQRPAATGDDIGAAEIALIGRPGGPLRLPGIQAGGDRARVIKAASEPGRGRNAWSLGSQRQG